MKYSSLPTEEMLQKTIEKLQENNMHVQVADTNEDAKKMALELIPQGAEVMPMTSVTLDTLGISEEINNSPKYNSVRNMLMKLNRETQSLEMQKLGAAPEYAIGSVHAVTSDGKVVVASNTGSQLPAYAYGSAHVIWVIGAQKIVKDLDEAMKRIYEYVLPLESERAHKAYGVAGSFVSKLLIFNKEQTPNHISIILVKQVLGY